MGNAQRKVIHRTSSKSALASSSGSKKVHWDRPGLPSAPGKPILIPGEEDSQPDVVEIRWERSSSNGGSAIIGYHVEHRKMGSPHWLRSAPVLCTFPEMTLSGLEPGWRYQFRIRAQNAVGLSEPSELSDPLTVTLQRTTSIPPRFELEIRDFTAAEGGQAEFVARFSGAPPPKISWFKDGFEIFSSRRTNIVTDGERSVFVIFRTALDDEGEIKCTATNRAGHAATRARLLVEAPPHIRLARQYDDGLLFEQGETIRLKATTTGRPPPSVTWYHDAEIVAPGARHRFESLTEQERILVIEDARRQDRGEYALRAINKLGEEFVAFLVTVTDRPGPPGKPRVTSTLGTSLTLAWSEPSDDGGCKIGSYIVEYFRVGWDVWLKVKTCRQTSVSLTDLIEGSEYRFRIKAENPYGLSEPSEESETVFIPDPKRGITEPNMRAKSQSHREIPRGRSALREVSFREPEPRTRSLTRDEATRHPQSIGSRTDSRVTFVLEPLSREIPNRLDDSPVHHPEIIIAPSYDDSGGEVTPTSNSNTRRRSLSRERSPARFELEELTEQEIGESVRKPERGRRGQGLRPLRANSRSDPDECALHGSSEFMLVLCPEDERRPEPSARDDNRQADNKRRRRSVGEAAGEEEDLVAPPMSASLPELFSADHRVVEVLREAVSSTELLHERAMERFLRAVEAEQSAEKARASRSNQNTAGPDQDEDAEDARLQKRLLQSVGQASSWQARREQRRSSEGRILVRVMRRDSATLTNASSDPSLSTQRLDAMGGSASPKLEEGAEGLKRWDKPELDLSVSDAGEDVAKNEIPIGESETVVEVHSEPVKIDVEEETRKILAELGVTQKVEVEERIYDEVPDESIAAEDSIETSNASDSDEAEYLKQLKATLLGLPVMREEDTYHPHGRVLTDTSQYPYSPGSVTPTGSLSPTSTVPRSILKKRTDTEPVPVNQFGRPIPPEKPIRRNSLGENHTELRRMTSTSNLTELLDDLKVEAARTADIMSQDSEEKEAVISAGEAAVTKRKQMRQGSRSTLSSDGEDDREEKLAVVSHYTEIVRDATANNYRYRSVSREPDDHPSFGRPQTPIEPPKSPLPYTLPDQNLYRREAEGLYVKPQEVLTSAVLNDQPEIKHQSEVNSLNYPSRWLAGATDTNLPMSTIARESNKETINYQKPQDALAARRSSLADLKTQVEQGYFERRQTDSNNQTEDTPIRPKERTKKPKIPDEEAAPGDNARSRPRRSRLDSDSKSKRTPSTSRATTPVHRKSDSIPASRNESPVRPSRNASRDRRPRSRASSKARQEPKTYEMYEYNNTILAKRKTSRPTSRASSHDRSRPATPALSQIERLNRALEEKRYRPGKATGKSDKSKAANNNVHISKPKAEQEVRDTFGYAIDVGLLIAAAYVYLFKKEIFAVPIIGLLLYRYIQEELKAWLPRWW